MPAKIKILIIILTVGIVLAGGWWVWEHWFYSSNYCVNLYHEFRNKIEKLDKSCQLNEDCKLTDLGICVNKNKYISEIEDLEKLLTKKCLRFLPAEMMPPDLKCKCENNLCKQIQERKQEEVSITTDKTEYEQGETVKITIQNNLTKSIWWIPDDCTEEPLDIFKYIEGSWKQIHFSTKILCNRILPEIMELKSGDSFEIPYDYWKGFFTPGRYKIGFKYSVIKPEDSELKEAETIYSNEFTIKEKEVDETANWKCYKENGISFKYPPNFEYKGGEGQVDFSQKGATAATLSFLNFSPAQIPLENWLVSATAESGHKIISKEVKDFGEVKEGILYIEELPNGQKQMGYVFNYGNETYSFWNEDSNTQNIFLKMLSTFRFLE